MVTDQPLWLRRNVRSSRGRRGGVYGMVHVLACAGAAEGIATDASPHLAQQKPCCFGAAVVHAASQASATFSIAVCCGTAARAQRGARPCTPGACPARAFYMHPRGPLWYPTCHRLQREYVVPGVQPPPDMFARLPEYVSFLGHTVRIARTAVLLPCDPRAGSAQQAGNSPHGVVVPNRDEAFISPEGA